MNKAVIGVVIVVLVVLGGWYVMKNKGDTRPESMNDLLVTKESLMCTFSETNAQANTTGTMYVADGKVRGDFSSVIAQGGQKVDSHLITDGQKVNVWTSAAPQGVEITIDPTKVDANGKSTQVDFEKKTDYHCQPWTIDATKFVIPADIQFIAPEAMVNPAVQAPNASTTINVASTTPAVQ